MSAYVHKYCDLAGMNRSNPEGNPDPCFYAHDGSTGTMLRIYGAQSILSEKEGIYAMVNAFEKIAPGLLGRGHALTITYERSENTEEEVANLIGPLQQAANRKGLNFEASLKELSHNLESALMAERILIVIWTYPEAAVAANLREETARRRNGFGQLPAFGVQDPEGPYHALQAAHWGMVKSIEGALKIQGFFVERLGTGADGRRDLTEIRRSIFYHETPEDWQPITHGAIRYPHVPRKKTSDISSLFPPRLNQQVMTGAVKGSQDMRTLEVGGRRYALAYLHYFPRHMTSAHSLFKNLGAGRSWGEPMPFRLAWHFEGGASVNGLKIVLATIGSVFSHVNQSIRHSLEAIRDAIRRDDESFVFARFSATTWTEPNEDPAKLNDRRARLLRGLNSWQAPTVRDSCPDPLRLLVETGPGVVASAVTGPPVIAPMRELAISLPFNVPAAIERQGQTIFTTTDGKPYPFQAHSPAQTNWLNLIWAAPGSGKSLLMNMMNLDFAAYAASGNLPYIGMLDIGLSSSGVIATLQAALPPEKSKLVAQIRMRNEADSKGTRVNPFDIGLGRREPLSREISFISNFLMAASGLEDNPLLTSLIETVVSDLFHVYSDLGVSGMQKLWRPSIDPEIDARCDALGIRKYEGLSWWGVTDALAEHGEFALAERAQRMAVPTLMDVVRYLSDAALMAKFGDKLCSDLKIQMETATRNFPAFTYATDLDIGEAMVIAIDIEHVVKRSPVSMADRRSNLIFFLMARELFVKKIAGDESEIEIMKLPLAKGEIYRNYWRARYARIAQTRKRFCFDEFHITGSSSVMANQVDQDVRQGRKWGLEMFLASQVASDFEQYQQLASNVFILKADNAQDRDEMQKVLGFSDAVKDALREHVHGPQATGEGAIILIGRKMQETGSTWQLARNKVGPVRLWALTTTMEDRALRERLYALIGVDEALTLLSKRFPTGSCRQHWSLVSSRVGENTDIAASIAEELVKEATAAS